jgi:hypothetical protein
MNGDVFHLYWHIEDEDKDEDTTSTRHRDDVFRLYIFIPYGFC